MHCAHSGKDLIAFAESFPITIKIVNKEAEVMGIGGVCVDPMHRGKKLGALIVNEAFSRVKNGEYPLCIFQTGVPNFYEELDCIRSSILRMKKTQKRILSGMNML